MSSTIYKSVALYGVFILGFLLYYPAVNGPYLFDDYPNLIQNEHLILEQLDLESIRNAALSSASSDIGRPISMLSFALNYTLAGNKDPYLVKLTNIILHLITGAGIFILLKLFLTNWIQGNQSKIFWTSLFITTLWLVHPLQVSTVLYSVQRMTILSALFTIFGLIAYLNYRRITILKNSHYLTLLITVSAFTLLGILSKENAILLPVFALLIEVTVFRFTFHPQTTGLNKVLIRAILYVPLLLIVTYLIFTYFSVSGELIWPYAFTIDQRLLTQTRVLMHYLGWILLLNPEPMSFYYTDFKLSAGLLNPVTTLFSMTTVIMLVFIGLISLLKQRFVVLGFGVFWFFIGHLIESTSIPLGLIYEHRNYLPSLGIVLIPAYILATGHLGIFTRHPASRLCFCLIIVLFSTLLTYERINSWRDEKSFVIELVRSKGSVSWTWADVAGLLSRSGDYINAIDAMQTAARLDPTEPAFIFGEANIRCQYEPDYSFPDDLNSRLSSAFTDKAVTPTTINSFVSMIRICRQTSVNDDVLRVVYNHAIKHNIGAIADIGRQAIVIMNTRSSE